jgi:hypothetical protein
VNRSLSDRHTATHSKVGKCVENEEALLDSNVNFVNELLTIYVNLITKVITVSEIKSRRH